MIRSFCFGAIFAASSSAALCLDAIQIDMDSRIHNHKRPIEIYLEAGEYVVTPINKQMGGKYTAQNAWSDSGRSYGCNQFGVCKTGFVWGVVVNGAHLGQEPLNQYRHGYHVLKMPMANYFDNWTAYSTADLAFENQSEEFTFSIAQSGFVKVHQPDSLLGDNFGGISVRIEGLRKVQNIEIDFKPGNKNNSQNTDSDGIVHVAALGNDELDVLLIDLSTLSFNGISLKANGKENSFCSHKDTNKDGWLDLSCKFRNDNGSWKDVINGSVALTGMLFDGSTIIGEDSITLKK